MGCLEEGSIQRRECVEEEHQGHSECSRRENQSSRHCREWRLQCPDWVAGWACNITNTLARWVCIVWVWVANIVCVAWTWVSHIVCVAWRYIVEIICLLWVMTVNAVDTLFGPGDRIDAHCHLFTGNTVLLYAVKGLIDIAVRIATKEPHGSATGSNLIPKPCPSASDEIDIVEGLIKIRNLVNFAVMHDSADVYKEMRHTYLYNYRVVPLMLDVAYCTDRGGLTALITRFDEARTTINSWISQNTDVRTLELLAELDDITRILGLQLSGLTQFGDYSGQALQLIKVSKRYKNRVFPFLSVDPRRPGILNFVKEYVGPDKPFHGIKLYAPTGFSPTDPVLFGGDADDDSLYRYCVDNGIPITAHCSPGGFGSFANAVHVKGHIQVREGVAITVTDGIQGNINSDGICEVDGTVNFSTSIESSGMDAMVAERSRTLNHPEIWRMVLERFPDLYLNLAHFGGQEDACLYAQNNNGAIPDYTPWTQRIAELMLEYPNVYTDLACYSDSEAVQLFKDQVYDEILIEEVKSKIMYGSDYNILMLFEASLADYVSDFKRIFGEDFDKLSIDNPNRFLFERG